MTIKDFINELKGSLQGELPAEEIRKHIDYYENYLYVKAKASNEEAAVTALGSPNLIAKTLINDYRMTHPADMHYDDTENFRNSNTSDINNEDSYNKYNDNNETDDNRHTKRWGNGKKVYRMNSKFLKILAVVIPILLIIAVFFLSRLLFKFFIPILFIVIIIYVIRGIFKR